MIPRLGGGALGGKGEGLVLIEEILARPVALGGGAPVPLRDVAPGLAISSPRTSILGTSVFEDYALAGGLREKAEAAYAPGGGGYAAVREAFLAAPLPEAAVADLSRFLPEAGVPLIARSSSLLEDAEGEPFAGIYESYAIPNVHPHPGARLGQLVDAVKLVCASLYSPDAIAYRASALRRAPMPGRRRVEDSMAVVVQELVGGARGRWYYPAISGTAESLNFYPLARALPEDGLCVAALGLGSYVVDGGASHCFCPKYPDLEAAPPELAGQGSQRVFRALDLERALPDLRQGESAAIAELELSEAEGSDALALAASTWDREDRRLVPGTALEGPRVLDFAPLLRYEAMPFAPAIAACLAAAEAATGGPVELEYALDASCPGGPPALFLLQLKKLERRSSSGVEIGDLEDPGCLVSSERAMGDGRIEGLVRIVLVDPERFDRSRSAEAAEEVAALDRELSGLGLPYLLIGPGRWGSRDPWLGLPVSYAQISGAAVIVETEMPGLSVDFSFGSHFLRNVAGRGVGYLAVPDRGMGRVDWAALAALPRERELRFCSILRAPAGLEALLDGRAGRAVVRAPARPSED